VGSSVFSISSLPYPLHTKDLKIGIAVAEWNHHITHLLRDGTIATLENAGISGSQIQLLAVPGAFELPLAAQMLANAGCDSVICLGCVVRGETPHFDYVCQAATDGILNVGLQTGKPIIFGVLTTDNEAQAMDRCGGKHGHKGEEAAQSALWMLAVAQNIKIK
jgi:6,7-dimethyl-8-ribityllumazine synthase